jgi:hypothetical protein
MLYFLYLAASKAFSKIQTVSVATQKRRIEIV